MTDRYALIGNPVSHSKSPLIHAEFARLTGQDLTYEAIEGPAGGFAATVDAFRAAGGRGINVTLPFKLDAFDYATERNARARLAGAVNCMKFEDGRAIAENYDGVGLVNDIQVNLGRAMAGRRVLLLGAGGAARGALLPFLEQKPALLVVMNRTVTKATALGQQFGGYGKLATGGYADFPGEAFDIVVNATSAFRRARSRRIASPTTSSTARARRRFSTWRGKRVRGSSPTASECWSSRPPRPSSGGAACAPPRGRSSKEWRCR
jgi:shikimate dehydrogenase